MFVVTVTNDLMPYCTSLDRVATFDTVEGSAVLYHNYEIEQINTNYWHRPI
jgi:hypothetical protein